MGKVVVSKSYFSMQYAKASTILYGIQNTNYLTSSYSDLAYPYLNSTFRGNIVWIAPAIIWIGFTISQKYPRRKPDWKDFFYYLAGIYLFYIGVTAGLNLPILGFYSLL